MEKQSLRELWAHELQDLWSTEQAMLEALPEAGSGSDDQLKQAFKDHQARAEGHLERLREIFLAETLAERSKARAPIDQRRPKRRVRRSGRGALGAGA